MSVKPILHEQEKPFPEAKIGELFTFSNGTSAFVKGTNTDQPNSFALWACVGAYLNCFSGFILFHWNLDP